MKAMAAGLVIVMAAGMAQANVQDLLAKPWSFAAVGNSDQLALRAGLRDGAGEVGLEGLWLDGLRVDQEAVGLSVYGTWDAIDRVPIPFTLPFGVGGGEVTATGYLGCKVGALANVKGHTDFDATAAGIVGLRFGSERVLVGLEWQAAVTQDMWSVMADTDKHVLMASITFRK